MPADRDDDPIDDGAPEGASTLTVSGLIASVNGLLADEFAEGVWVEGEIEGFKPSDRHIYFTLAEKGKDKAQLSCALFSFRWGRIKPKLEVAGVSLKDGMKIRVFGTPDVYAPSGRFSFKVSDVDTRFAAGDIALKREQLLRKLRENGATERNKGRSVSRVPLRLGVVSSANAAGWADAREHLIESGYSFSIVFCPVQVQGDGAAEMITAAVRTLGARGDLDVILVMRGGGAKGDLADFDDERVALAIADCPVPVFTGIGHEIDRSIADEVAHTACRTPTACADEVIELVAEFVADLEGLGSRLVATTGHAIERSRGRLDRATDRVHRQPPLVLERQRAKLEVLSQRARLLDPVTTMSRGWSITRRSDGRTVASVADVSPGDTVTTTVADGTFTSTVGAATPTNATESTRGRTT